MKKLCLLITLGIFFIPIVLAGELEIGRLELPKEINPDSTYELYLNLESIDWNGSTTLTISAEHSVFTNSRRNILLEGEKRTRTYMKTGLNETYDTINVELCTTQVQFSNSDPYCINRNFDYQITEKESTNVDYSTWIIGILFIIIVFFIGKGFSKK